jgi:putative membrane protein
MTDLANERTYMAWTRTALSSAALGVVLMKAFFDDWRMVAAGMVLLVQGLIFLVYAAWRYYRVTYLIMEEKFDPAKIAVAVFTVMTVAVVAAISIVLAVSANITGT